MSDTLEIPSSAAQKTISDLTGELETYRNEKLEEIKPKKLEEKVMTQGEYSEAEQYFKRCKSDQKYAQRHCRIWNRGRSE